MSFLLDMSFGAADPLGLIDLAVAFDADEYPRPVQQQRRIINALSDEICQAGVFGP
jgi:hypothetical protein